MSRAQERTEASQFAMDEVEPAVITRSDPTRIEIQWSDGHRSAYTTARLRGLCPCAQCVDEVTGRRVHDPGSVPADLEHRDVQLVGNYAITIQFADGHATGIFPFRFLRQSDPDAPAG